MSDPFLTMSWIHRREVTSTSDLAREMVAADDAPRAPFVVLADRQTAGRGRGSNTWYSDPGSLTFTLVFDPAATGLPPAREPMLALAAACGIARFIEFLTTREDRSPVVAGIRWPNDVEVADRKLAGILPERVEGRTGPRILMGIGLNVANDLGALPREVASRATSLAREDEWGSPVQDIDGPAFLMGLLPRLAESLRALASGDAALIEEWTARDTLRGRPVQVQLPDRLVVGVGAGIDADGHLRLATEAGVVTLAGGIVLRKP